MQTSYLPQGTCESLDQSNRNFLWGGSEEKRKIHLVAWPEVCKTKRNGGLGIRHAHAQNQAYMMKLGWQLTHRKDDLWVKIVRDKYKCGSDVIPNIDQRRLGSNVWSGIKSVWDKAKQNIEVNERGQCHWLPTKESVFTVKSAYESFCEIQEPVDPFWSKVWKLKLQSVVKLLFGLLLIKEY